ncbi:peptidoglycan DD-metalloendopeptidase family protein [Lysobacter sp. S4-A87]|uniref:M23 family metallopeptidase n=1 Tax=Lysobacter sp. S4-A87 TaxID=2925843 RepID=UPI001F53941E|nr:M23 family metallopeptidase [Lysobacter sp. S4-A87]UNK49062.1 peptidoglycan DD-metalloendopeptidase family protein [Lysobacter sp. S4-A87]
MRAIGRCQFRTSVMLHNPRRQPPSLVRSSARRLRSGRLASLHVAGAALVIVLATQDSPAASHEPSALPDAAAMMVVALPQPGPIAASPEQPFAFESAKTPADSMRLPLDAIRVTSGFGLRNHPLRRRAAFHNGIDFAAPPGTAVHASADGVVARAAFSKDYGNLVLIDHGNGCSTLYAHNERLLVHTGEPIQAGQPIALVGSSGRSTGPHLHFEVRHDGARVDPRNYLAGI